MAKIFISYRRGDSPGYAGRLHDRLLREFGPDNLFIDIDTLKPGDDFVDSITQTLNECAVLLAVVGPRWANAVDAQNRPRLEDELDFVRLEIQTALERKIRVIPVLVEQARMPETHELPAPLYGLRRRQAIELSDIRWSYDVGRLVETLRPIVDASPAQVAPPPAPKAEHPVNTPASPRVSTVHASPELWAPVADDWRVSRRPITKIDLEKWLEDSLTVSTDNLRVAHIEKRPGLMGLVTRFSVCVNGVFGREYDNVQTKLVFSPDGSRIAYGGVKNGQWLMVDQGNEGSPFDNLLDGTPVFSPDSQRIAYGARKDSKWTVVVDDEAGPLCDGIMAGTPIFSPDSRRVAYGALKNGKWTVVIDGRESPLCDGILSGSPVFSPDGRRVAYGVLKNGKWVVVVDGKESRSFDGLQKGMLTFSPDSKRVAWGARRGDDQFVVVDQTEGPSYEGLGAATLGFSPDSRRIAYGARRGEEWMAVLDGREEPACDGLLQGTPIFGGNGQIVYGARRDEKWAIVFNGAEGRPHEGLMAGTPVLSPDGQQVAYGALDNGKWRVVVGEEEGKSVDLLTDLVFGPDSRTIAYMAKTGSEWTLVLNGRERPTNGAILRNSTMHFENAKRLRVLIAQGGDVFLLTFER